VNAYRLAGAPRDEPVCRHLESHRPATVSITGHTSWVLHLLDVPKESFTPGKPDADESYMALTFGTLLSSQGADAHRHNPFGRIGGNPSYFTWSVPLGQTPAPAQTPTWSGRPRSWMIQPRASCLGEHSPGSVIGHPLGWPLARLRPANKENISRGSSRDANSPPGRPYPPYLLGQRQARTGCPRSNFRVPVV